MSSHLIQREPGSPEPPRTDLGVLRAQIDELEATSGARAMAVSLYDYESSTTFRSRADRWFHAASTIKVAILIGVFAAIHRGLLHPHARLHVRNRFLSAADARPFRVDPDRDANPEVQAAIGKTMRIVELAHHMIATSSNLATNLLLELVGIELMQQTLEELGVDGVDVRRGVEDERAFEAGINNRITADGLVTMLRLIHEERAFTPELSRQMLDILHAQEFKSGIPAGLPSTARVAHKTGEISTVAHDAGIVYLPHRKPYVLAVLTEWEPGASRRSPTIAAASYDVYQWITGDEDGDD